MSELNKPENNHLLAHRQIEILVRGEWGKLLSCLISYLGDFQLAEDALQDALESALIHWQRNGLPRSPAGWLLQTARRKAIDRIRRVKNFKSKQSQYLHMLEMDREDAVNEATQNIPDERLRLIFTCCHPALEEKSRIALTLRTLGGLTTEEIARAFLDSENAMAQRLVRAKRKIKAAAIPYIVPDADQWGERLETVLDVLYLIFNEGYFSGVGENHIRAELSNEAIRLAGILLQLKPGEPEVEGLLALMLLHDSRREAREGEDGFMVALDKQDRKLWDRVKIAEGLGYLNLALNKSQPGAYQIQAAISAIHAEAATADKTGWREIVLLYDELYKFQPNPVVLLNRCVAISYASGPQTALQLLNELAPPLINYQPFYAAKADLLRRSGDEKPARAAYAKAIEMATESKTRRFLKRQLATMTQQ